MVLYEPGVLSALDAAAIARSQDVGTATAFRDLARLGTGERP